MEEITLTSNENSEIVSESTIGGISVQEIIAEYGSPLYIYDLDVIRGQYRRLKHAFSGFPSTIKYAVKALSNVNILKALKQEGCGLDCVSMEEVYLGLHAGYQPHEILFTPNCVSFDEITRAVEAGIAVNIDNISILEQFGHEYGNSVPVCIRINPHIMAGGNMNISTGHIDSKFGISIHQLRHVQRVVASNNINVNGLHMHTGSDILDPDVFMRAAEILFEVAEDFPSVEFLDFGSGFKVPYKPDDHSTDVESLGKKLAKRWEEFRRKHGRSLHIFFEPGKYIVSESGSFVVKVNVVKQTTATVFAGVDSGFNHLIRPMFYNAYHHIENISNPNGTPRIYTVVGYICETDTFAWDRKIAEIREGDLLLFRNAGAYGFQMASNYNSRPRPAEVAVEQGKTRLIRRRENFDDLIRTQIIED